ncbi:type IV secretion system protein [Streptobacillus moniliformis]|uniref:Type IV secretory pathway TrbF protein-like protein n=1 Tax=Streptobacillus moniliformis (strain ATCC 14647 / DSM 12112 / NCTC 10651 / 9901) TaxID=519441 RepID=D1AYI9_STRM9|nr:type IV secretion system protein [Streptobacillus moniliformis]ACZ01365.1 Type IV secretory pathway TrbF protein-like protein [Streptobacillus moniliformis DSM 12112]AVL43621.1 type IV secretion protein [Streptobacillus moniliformis]SQA13477.1 conjugal transfer protein TrbF [Streptobacillus moniliformis]SQA14571.1 conjugal transfer protein TrbF [Streptobacillus moniliformis]
MKENRINKMRKNFIVDENKTSRNKEKLSLGIERYVAISEALNIWKRAFIGMSIMTISFACLSTFLFINKSETKSYLIKVNNNGELIGTEKLSNQITNIGNKEIEYFMKKFIKDSRTITLDRKVFDKTIREASYFLNKETQSKLSSILSNENVYSFFEIGKTREVEILSFVKIPESENTYQIRWREKEYEKNGDLSKRKNLNAIVKTKRFSPNSEQIIFNPFGIVIVDFNMQVEN